MPIINGIEYEIEQGECWKNVASSWWHGSSPVVGNKERIVLSLGSLIKNKVVSKQLLADDIYQLPIVKKVFDTNVVIQSCPYPEYYSSDNIITKIVNFVRQFDQETPEQKGKAYTSCTAGLEGQVAHFDYLHPLLLWVRNTVWNNRHYFKGGNKATGISLGRNWINEMHRGCLGIEHKHKCPVAVFYIRIPPGGADMIFVNDNEYIPAGVKEGDLLIHDRNVAHSVSEHKSDITRICLILEFDFV